ncbi:MAG TPA: hypothetical protein VF297_25660 [Pyrinomonadaceae bacterium]
MKNLSRAVLYASLCLAFAAGAADAQEQKFASLGDFKLESGEVIRDCRIGYRTFGTINNEKFMNDPGWRGGEYTDNPARAAEYEFGALLLTTPEEFNRRMTREKLFEELARAKTVRGFDANDKIRQDQAMMSHDVSERFGGSMERAGAAVRARVLVVVAARDHVVTPGPATEFARLLKARLLTLEGDCDHLAPGCESRKVNPAVAEFLQAP